LAILACESQDKVHYAMPVRMMVYDGLSYTDQIQKLWEKDKRENKIKSEEFLSKFRKEDKLIPILSLVFYYGQEPWDGSIHLHEMLEIPEGMKDQKFLQEYLPLEDLYQDGINQGLEQGRISAITDAIRICFDLGVGREATIA
ncbi:MAG: hypothetical protein ACI4ES_06305, partial [Roseburia sp.]